MWIPATQAKLVARPNPMQHRWPRRALLDGVLYVLRTGCASLAVAPSSAWPTRWRWLIASGPDARLAHRRDS